MLGEAGGEGGRWIGSRKKKKVWKSGMEIGRRGGQGEAARYRPLVDREEMFQGGRDG